MRRLTRLPLFLLILTMLAPLMLPIAQTRAEPGGVVVVLGQWADQIQQASAAADVPWQVVAAIVMVESAGDATLTSPSGGVGLMQVRPDLFPSAAGLDLTDPATNLTTGVTILASLYERWGNWSQVAAAYSGRIDERGNVVERLDDHGLTGREYVALVERQSASLGFSIGPVSVPYSLVPREVDIVRVAMTTLGTPYVWGGESYEEGGFDCSGLVQWAWAQLGVSVVRTAAEQFAATERLDPADVQPGDLIFFANTTPVGRQVDALAGPRDGGQAAWVITHVGIYVGNGMMLHAPDVGEFVRVDKLDTPFWRAHLAGYGRIATGG
ncbi:MAG TPA: C40 family peptidase [Thermomicrobiales bacterium]|nr:C40 family peptidase [Thermomicrobiales bacterium]